MAGSFGSERFLDRLRQASAIRPIGTSGGSGACSRVGSRPGDRGGVQPVRGRPGSLAWLPVARLRRPRLPGEAPYRAHRRLVPILGLSRPERLPNLSTRFAACSAPDPVDARGISWHWNSPSGRAEKILNRSDPKDWDSKTRDSKSGRKF